jgi:hypothetical protein
VFRLTCTPVFPKGCVCMDRAVGINLSSLHRIKQRVNLSRRVGDHRAAPRFERTRDSRGKQLR